MIYNIDTIEKPEEYTLEANESSTTINRHGIYTEIRAGGEMREQLQQLQLGTKNAPSLTFERFGNLPQLREMIWSFALPSIVEVLFDFNQRKFVSSTPRPCSSVGSTILLLELSNRSIFCMLGRSHAPTHMSGKLTPSTVRRQIPNTPRSPNS
jgi:hypothetical protein